MKVIGLTGGVACGKTTAAKQLKELGFPVVDTDQISHDLLESDRQIREKIEREFGTTVRARLRDIVFSDPTKRKRLQEILHPPIGREVVTALSDLRRRKPSPNVVIIVVPLLFEVGWDKRTDAVIAVVASRSNQLTRLMKRDGMTEEFAQRMIDSQLSCDEKAARSTHVITNDGSLDDLRHQVQNLAQTF